MNFRVLDSGGNHYKTDRGCCRSGKEQKGGQERLTSTLGKWTPGVMTGRLLHRDTNHVDSEKSGREGKQRGAIHLLS